MPSRAQVLRMYQQPLGLDDLAAPGVPVDASYRHVYLVPENQSFTLEFKTGELLTVLKLVRIHQVVCSVPQLAPMKDGLSYLRSSCGRFSHHPAVASGWPGKGIDPGEVPLAWQGPTNGKSS